MRDEESVKEGLDRCYRLLEKKKTAGFSMHRRMIDYGGSLRCAETNLLLCPTGQRNFRRTDGEKPISAESLAKYRRRLDQTEYFRDILPPGWQFPLRMDQLGGTLDEKKYIAVVHIDGNRMRDKIARFNQSMERKSGETGEAFDRRYIQGQGSLSREIDEKYRGAFLKLNQRLAKIWECLREDLDMEEGVLPIRPLILAGDDICYVTDGRIALETARIFLEYIQQENVQGLPLNACAGVAVVKAHFPFSRAYQLAEELCRNAKNQIPEGTDASWLDWHVDQGRIAGQPAGGQGAVYSGGRQCADAETLFGGSILAGRHDSELFACAGSSGGQNGCQIQGSGPAGSHASGKGCRPICSAVQPDAGSDSETGMV